MRRIFLLVIFVLAVHISHAQDSKITGRVVDETGQPITGATIYLPETKLGTSTNFDGEFSISGEIDQQIVIGFIGYKEITTIVKRLHDNLYTMSTDDVQLDDVVVVAMGTQKRATITAAVTTLKGDAIVDRPVTDVTSALQGNIPGLTFSVDATSAVDAGQPGATTQFNIRGAGSINGGGGAPYVLIDGIEQSLSNVNPADVESITVLKDASAAAVYGDRAAYGVILVTTKSGKEGRAKVSYRGSVGFSSPISMPEQMNSIEYANYVNERYALTGMGWNTYNSTMINLMQEFMKNPYSGELTGVQPNIAGDGWNFSNGTYANTDWLDYRYKDFSLRQSHNISITGGTKTVRYYVGMGYTHQGGLIDFYDDNLDRYNLNTKLNITATDWLKLSINNNITLSMIERPMQNAAMLFNYTANANPTHPIRLPVDSEYNIPTQNQDIYLQSSEYNQNVISDALQLSATATVLKGWDVTASFKTRLDIDNDSHILRQPYYMEPDGDIVAVASVQPGYQPQGIAATVAKYGTYTRGSMFNAYLSPNINTQYTRSWGRHYFQGMAGYQMEYQYISNEYSSKDGMMSDDIFSFENAAGDSSVFEGRDHWTSMGFFARFNYNYDEKYFVELSGRYDGSSRFAPTGRWGFFPSVSAGYNMAKAEYFKDLNTSISMLKVRASYGLLGNRNGAGYYDYLGTMRIITNSTNTWLLPDYNSYTLPPTQISEDITWETVESINLGIDLTAFDDRLNVTADIYQRTTHDMLGPAEPIPAISGIDKNDLAKTNNSTLRNRGWELSVNWADKFDNGLSYGVGLNIFDYKAVVTEYNNPTGVIYNNHTGYSANIGYYEGMDVGEIWGYHANSLYMTHREIDSYLSNVDMSAIAPNDQWVRGDLKYIDTNGDGKVDFGDGTIYDHGDLDIIGNTTPRYSFGINLNVGYKGFEISTLLQGVMKRDFPLAASSYLFGGQQMFTEHLDYWSPSNPDAYLPRLTWYNNDTDRNKNTGYNTTRYLMNGAYLRMKNLVVSYKLNSNVVKKIGLSGVKIYVSCDNVFTIDDLPSQFDPETLNKVNPSAGGSTAVAPGLTSPANNNGNGIVYPLSRTFIAGLDITL